LLILKTDRQNVTTKSIAIPDQLGEFSPKVCVAEVNNKAEIIITPNLIYRRLPPN
jgi:hypothetical protein